MTIRRLTKDDFEQIYQIYISHTSFQGLPRIASIYNEQDWDQRWYNYHLASFDKPSYFWFGDVENGIIKTIAQFEVFYKNEQPIVSNGWQLKNKQVNLPKTMGQQFWPDSNIYTFNHAVDLFESNNMYVWYSPRRGAKALPNQWVPIISLPQCKLSTYISELVEEIPAGGLPKDPDILAYVTKSRKTIAQAVYKLTKPLP